MVVSYSSDPPEWESPLGWIYVEQTSRKLCFWSVVGINNLLFAKDEYF
jgi:hypothetical protein